MGEEELKQVYREQIVNRLFWCSWNFSKYRKNSNATNTFLLHLFLVVIKVVSPSLY